jgi:hypothetical protein
MRSRPESCLGQLADQSTRSGEKRFAFSGQPQLRRPTLDKPDL